MQTAVDALLADPSPERLYAARRAWTEARPAYLRTEAFQFYAGPVDAPGGPAAPAERLADRPSLPRRPPRRSLGPARLPQPRPAQPGGGARPRSRPAGTRSSTCSGTRRATGPSPTFVAGEGTNDRRRDYLAAVAQLLVNDLGLLVAAWAPDTNNYRAAVEAMDQRNAVGRAFNGMTVLAGYEIPLRRIGAGLFPANANFQQSPFSDTSAADNRFAFEGARAVYTDAGFDDLLSGIDPALAAEVHAAFERADAALVPLDAPPYDRFLAPPPGSPERADGRGRGARPDRSRPRAAPGGQPPRRARGRPRALSPDLARLTTASQAQAKASIPAPTDAKRRGPHTTRTQRGITMLTRCLLASTALALAGAAQAQDILPVVDVATEAANDLRGVTFAADGKIYVSGHKGDVETETATVIGRFNADGTPDAAFGEDGFVEVDLAPGRVEQSLAVAELSGGDVVAVVNAVDEDGGQSVYLLRFDCERHAEGRRRLGRRWRCCRSGLRLGQCRQRQLPRCRGTPRGHRLGSAGRRDLRRGEARGRGLRRRGRRHRPHRQRPLRRAASRRRRKPRSGFQRRRALHLPLGADLRRRRPARRRRSRRLDHERRLHQPRRDAAATTSS